MTGSVQDLADSNVNALGFYRREWTFNTQNAKGPFVHFGRFHFFIARNDPAVLKAGISRLTQLVEQARQREARDVQSKLLKLKAILEEQGVFDKPKMKLLIFTEHKDTLDYLAADGRDERPLGKWREWGLTLTQIHGGMKIRDRDSRGSRIGVNRNTHFPFFC